MSQPPYGAPPPQGQPQGYPAQPPQPPPYGQPAQPAQPPAYLGGGAPGGFQGAPPPAYGGQPGAPAPVGAYGGPGLPPPPATKPRTVGLIMGILTVIALILCVVVVFIISKG